MTTGTTRLNAAWTTIDGWPYYEYTQKDWAGDDTPPAQRIKVRTKKTFSYWTTEIVNGHKVPVQKTAVRYYDRPSANRFSVPHNYRATGKYMKQDKFTFKNANATYSGGIINELPWEVLWNANDDIALTGYMRDEIAGSSFNAGVALAESAKTCSMIASNATALYKSLRAAKRGNFRKAWDELQNRDGARPFSRPKRAASSFLELKYGWMPLLQDVHEGARFLAYNYNAPRRLRVVSQRNAGGQRARELDLPYWGLPDNGGNIMVNMIHKESKRVIAYVTEVDIPQLSGLTDPLSIAWELVPYSFVADWFIPIGNWLQGRGLAQAIKGQYVLMHRIQRKFNYVWINQNSGSPFRFIQRPDNAAWEQYYFDRKIFNNIPMPPRPIFKPLSSVVSWSHATSAVALLTNVFSPKARIR